MERIIHKNENFTWYNFTNPTKEEIIDFSKQFNLSYYAVMDSLEPGHLPKIEEQEDAIFILVRFYQKSDESFLNSVREYSNKLAIYYGNNFIITVHQNDIPFLDNIQKKYLQPNNKTTINELVTKLLWHSANSYLNPILMVSEKINVFEGFLYNERLKNVEINKIYDIKRESSTLKRVLIMSKEVINTYKTTASDESSLQDVRELHLKLIHLCDQNTEDSVNIMNTYLSLSSNKTNSIMELLTIFSAFFLPLTFIVGIYGMNFNYMPELTYKWGYFCVLGFMLLVVIFIYVWFRKRKII